LLKILGIETSCDDTSVAVVSENKQILANEVISQTKEHALFGGVVPEVASRSHLEYLDKLLDHIEDKAKIDFTDIDAIAVTSGPGLIGGVMVGVMYAKAIAAVLNKPIIAVNHLEGHALTVRLTDDINYPFLLLLVSGGHTQFLIIKDLGCYESIGSTLDDALGEAFDKVAKMLGLGYPGGPAVEKMAANGNPNAFIFPKPLCGIDNCNFSFSGLKTAVKRAIDEIGEHNITTEIKCNIAASFQKTICEILKVKSLNAISIFNNHLNKKSINKNFVIAGGVAANSYIRNELGKICEDNDFKFYVPPVNLCTDNAAMIAWVGVEKFKKGMFSDLNFKPYSKKGLGI